MPWTSASRESELSRAKALAEDLANHDPLTGLPNRALLEDRIERVDSRFKRHFALADTHPQ